MTASKAPRRGRRRVAWAAALAVLVAVAAVAIQLATRDRSAPWRVSTPAGARGAHVAHAGWSVRLRGRGPAHGTLTLASRDDAGGRWHAGLSDLTAQEDVQAGEPVHVALAGGRLGRRGAVMRRTLPEPVAPGARAVLAYFDPQRGGWHAVPTRLSRDRRTLVAHVTHFSLWDHIVYGVGWLLDLRVDRPSCEGPTPAWVREDDITFLDDGNAPLRWCVGHDPADRSILVVKVAVNRSYGVAVRPATAPRWVWDNLFQGGPDGVLTGLLARAYGVPDRLDRTFGGQLPLLGGQEADFGFTEQQVRDVAGRALIRVSPDAKDALAGFTYAAISEAAGDEGIFGRQVAAVVALVAVAQCESQVLGPLAEHAWQKLAKAMTQCLTANPEAVAKLTAATLTVALPRAEPKRLGRVAGKVGGKLWQLWLAGAVFKFGTWLADRKLDGAAFELHAFPRIARHRRPPPEPEPEPEATPPPPVTTTVPPAADGLEVGAEFSSTCVVAWPTAPSHSSQGIQMTMSCSEVPESEYLFTDVLYGDPSFKITPGTGPVQVHGQVVDVARSEYGYSELVVVADDVVAQADR